MQANLSAGNAVYSAFQAVIRGNEKPTLQRPVRRRAGLVSGHKPDVEGRVIAQAQQNGPRRLGVSQWGGLRKYEAREKPSEKCQQAQCHGCDASV